MWFMLGIFAVAYVVCLLVIVFALSELCRKALENGEYVTFVTMLILMIVLFFGAFLFAKFIFGF